MKKWKNGRMERKIEKLKDERMETVFRRCKQGLTVRQTGVNRDVKRGFSRGKKGVMTIAQQLRCTYAAIAMHVRSNCNARAQQLLRYHKKAVSGQRKRRFPAIKKRAGACEKHPAAR
jgi:hypothetical protein